MPLKTKPLDLADGLDTVEDIAGFLEAAFDGGGPADVAHALGIVARSKGMGVLAAQTGLSRQALHQALSAEGNPTLDTLLKVIRALGLRLVAEPT